MGPVQTLHNHRGPAQFESAIAIVKPTDSNPARSYTGAVFAYKEKGSNLIRTITALCRALGRTQVMQKLGVRQLLTAKKFTASRNKVTAKVTASPNVKVRP
jgi:hypothetical protein